MRTRVEKTTTAPEIWAGVECTVNRVGDRFSDQLIRTGHSTRLEDLERLAELGVRTLRYPVLWERVAPDSPTNLDWRWSDERLDNLGRLRLNPIVGLVHHGSGPAYTNLLDPEFPQKLAAYARKVAERYPWITDYTPINEPLTTARFSCLYGHWYPHTRDPLLFAQAFLNECRAIVLAMKAIRTINSSARLIQTEDLGKTVSTPTLKYQADFENERRWLTFDLLCGRLDAHSPMWSYFRWLGIQEEQLHWFQDNFVEPELLGVNHYVTSERFLDERLNRYPSTSHGGNGRHLYADVEAVRVAANGVAGPKAILREVWTRYRLPIAVTEVHLGCTREEQLRWLHEVWSAAVDLRSEQIDVRAITLWGAFGAFDWHNLLTAETGHYEPGIFDLRAVVPRSTALAKCTRRLAAGEQLNHPVLDTPGWWRRPDRYCYPPVGTGSVPTIHNGEVTPCQRPRPILITGATGTLGSAFARICEGRGLAYVLLNRQQLDIAQLESVQTALDSYKPWAVINAAGYVRVDDAEREIKRCYRENVIGPGHLASVCADRKVKLVTFSSDLVFDGLKESPYVESDKPSPLSIYGTSKVEAEQRVLEQYPEALVIRTGAFFGPWDRYNFVRAVLAALQRDESFSAIDDVVVSPTYVPDLVHASLDLMIDDEEGIWHIVSEGSVTWCEFARRVAVGAGYEESRVEGRPAECFDLRAKRPAFSALTSERGHLMPTFDQALEKFFSEADVLTPAFAKSA
jgi:dTDP-4-dehydrorhamnose reductase